MRAPERLRPEQLRFSALGRRDVPKILEIEQAAFPEPWSAAIFASELALGDERSYQVARRGRAIVGYFGLMFVEGDAHVTTVAVAPELQGQGIGRALMVRIVRTAISRGAENLSLEVATGNLRAQSLYRSFGLAPVGVRKRYYPGTGEDAIVMLARDLGSEDYQRRLAQEEARLRSSP